MRNLHVILFAFALLCLEACDNESGNNSTGACSEITEHITETTTLTNRVGNSNLPDYCINSIIEVRNGAGLIIEPGVVIEFGSNAGLAIGGTSTTYQGYIIAEGGVEDADKIRFTGAEKVPGFWKGVFINSSSQDVRNLLDNCIIEYAGSTSYLSSFSKKPALTLYHRTASGILNVKNTTIQHNDAEGFVAEGGDEGIRDFYNNTFLDNKNEAIITDVTGFHKMDNSLTFVSNGVDGVVQHKNTPGNPAVFNDGIEYIWKALSDNAAYYLISGLEFRDGGLTLEPGVEIVCNDNRQIHIRGNAFLNAKGTSANPVVFKGEVEGVSTWNSILFESNNALNELDYCEISEAGVGPVSSLGVNGNAAVGIYSYASTDGAAKITNCTISHTEGCGISTPFDNMGNLTQNNNSFLNNTGNDICN